MPLADGDPESIGNYELESHLGTGGMGVVYLGRSAAGRQVAVKVVHERFAEDPEFRARFRQEVAAARRVSGAFTAPVVDADTDAVFPWMATQYIPGMSLSEQVRKCGPLSSEELWRLAIGLAEALRDIHRVGVVHRDLKPANVLMHPDGPRVIDFGISRAAESELRTQTGKVMGTPPFMAPEQFVAARKVGLAADVFALGSVLVHAATGHGPFDADSPHVAVTGYRVVHDEPNLDGLPEAMHALVAHCLEKAAEKRPTAEEFLDALRSKQAERKQLEGRKPSGSPAASLTDPAPPVKAPARRRKMRPAAAAAGALCIATIVLLVPGADTNDTQSVSGDTPSGWKPWQTAWRANPTKRPHLCTLDTRGVFCSSPDTTLMKLDPATGHTSWNKERYGSNQRGGFKPPTVGEGLVYTVSADHSRGIDAFDAKDGRRRWHIDGPVDMFEYLGGLVITTKFPPETPPDPDSRSPEPPETYTAFDAQTGKRLWQRNFRSSKPFYADSDNTLYAAILSDTKNKDSASSWTLFRVETDTGKFLRQVEFPKNDLWLTSVHNETAYYMEPDNSSSESEGDYGRLYIQDLATGKIKRIDLPWSMVLESPPQVHDNIVYFFNYDDETILALDLESGKPLWNSSRELRIFSEPVVHNSRLYVIMPDTSVLVLDARTGKQLWRTETSFSTRDGLSQQKSPATPPAVAGDVLYCMTEKGVFSVSARRPHFADR